MEYVPGTDTYMLPVPKPRVKLVGKDGNAFMILGLCSRVLKTAGVEKAVVDAFQKEATSGDYGNVLRTAMKYCDVS